MGLITQYSRMSHHTIFGLTGSTFSVPATEDFTSGSWTIYDLALSEIGVNETDEKAYIRIGNTIKEFEFAGGTSTPVSIFADNGLTITGPTISLGGVLNSETVISGASYGLSLGDLSSRLRTLGVETYDSIYLRDDDTISLSVLDLTAAGGGAKLSSGDQVSGSGGEFSASALGRAHVQSTNGTDIFKIELDAESTNTMVVTDNITSRGLQYAADYSAQFITHSLITKAYVDSQISNATQSLSEVLADGNSTGTFSIVLGSTSTIQSQDGNETISIPNDGTIVLAATSSIQHNASLTNADATTYINAEYSTTNGSAQIMFTIPLPTDRIISISCIFTGLDITGNQAYVNQVYGAIKNIGGSLSIVGISMDVIEKKDFSTAVASIETSGTNVVFVVQGEASTNINWTMRANYQILK